jgi:hypothetical protein
VVTGLATVLHPWRVQFPSGSTGRPLTVP